jgi:hypothetical protein
MSEIVESPAGHASAILALGRRLAEQYQQDNGASYQLASLAHPVVCKQAMQATQAEQDFHARCQALGGITPDAARQILADTVAEADQHGLPAGEVWDRAWQRAIEESMR